MRVWILLFLVLAIAWYLTQQPPGIDKVLVLSCMDYRFITQTVQHLKDTQGQTFDYFVLAGASLGYNESQRNPELRAWDVTFEDHIELAIDLHQINEIVIIDHSDCGMYQATYNDYEQNWKQLHVSNIKQCINSLKQKHPELKYKGILILENDDSPEFEVVVEI